MSSQSVGLIDSAGQVYGPIDAQGQYHLLGCRPGYILVNDSVATQSCIACGEGTYSLNPIDGCGPGGVCSQRSVCQQCPAGLTCPGLASYKPTVPGSIWVPAFDQQTTTTILHLVSCPAGNCLVTKRILICNFECCRQTRQFECYNLKAKVYCISLNRRVLAIVRLLLTNSGDCLS